MSVKEISSCYTDGNYFRIHRKTKELVVVEKQNVTIWNLVKSLFGCGPLAYLDRSSKKISAYFIKNESYIASLKEAEDKESKNALLAITKLANHLFLKNPEDRELFELVSQEHTLSITIDLKDEVPIGGNQRKWVHFVNENVQETLNYYDNELMPSTCLAHQVRSYAARLQEILVGMEPVLKNHSTCAELTQFWFLYNEETNTKTFYPDAFNKSDVLAIPILMNTYASINSRKRGCFYLQKQ